MSVGFDCTISPSPTTAQLKLGIAPGDAGEGGKLSVSLVSTDLSISASPNTAASILSLGTLNLAKGKIGDALTNAVRDALKNKTFSVPLPPLGYTLRHGDVAIRLTASPKTLSGYQGLLKATGDVAVS